ncbi:glycosyltransferase family 2 protein [Mucilaginibacter arboris]|uniref:Glycosyltransferase n=1 Tax=Mucilaginibacter arboris TaxID=2682090 RepID=A0A7K1SX58_9SPHI|nr:glycosyltransferase [Mucilaginibacter arboris]MVN21909.1 glycosyltransferase [Mucilaginibacter arboris]
MAYHFPQVTLLVTHYNRSRSLEHLLNTFKNQECTFGGTVISDDGSKPEHLKAVKKLQQKFNFDLITSPENKGLGNNINKGQDAVKTPYTLYIQEDFEPDTSFTEHFLDAMQFLKEDPKLDLVRFYAYLKYPYLKPYKKGFSEMLIKPWFTNYKKIYYYSDHPHVRRSSFFNKFGRYAEGLKGDKTEYKMCVSFIKNKGKALFYDDYKGLFKQINPANEPSTMSRSNWTQSENYAIAFVRAVYRQLKYNFDLLF